MTDAVWITPTWPWAEAPVGGIFFRTQATALARLGAAVTVVCPTPLAPWPLSGLNARWHAYANAPSRAIDEGVTVVRPRYPNLPGEPSAARPDRFIARAAWSRRRDWRGARVVHGHFSVTGLAARRVATRAGLPYVLTFHGSDMNSWPDDHPGQLPALRAAVREAGEVIAVSRALATRIRSLTGRSAVHLPIGVDHRKLAAATLPRDEARHALDLPATALVVLFVGNLLRAKGVPELAEAVAGLGPDVHGVFVGGGSGEVTGQDDPAAGGRLHYVGLKPHDAVMRYMSAADVLVLPSRSEGLPTVVVEAGSIALPVIGTAVGGIPELIGGGRGSLLPEVSVDAIRAAIIAFAADRDGAVLAARRLSDLVHADYDVDRNAARLLEIYRDVAPRTSARAGSISRHDDEMAAGAPS